MGWEAISWLHPACNWGFPSPHRMVHIAHAFLGGSLWHFKTTKAACCLRAPHRQGHGEKHLLGWPRVPCTPRGCSWPPLMGGELSTPWIRLTCGQRLPSCTSTYSVTKWAFLLRVPCPESPPFFLFSQEVPHSALWVRELVVLKQTVDSVAKSNARLPFCSLKGSSEDLKFCVLYLAEVSPSP